MPRARSLLFALVLAACGGGESPSVTQPPPPPPPPPPPVPTIGPPASIAIQAGDNQTASPLAATGTRLSVVVKDASGLAVPNTAVTFTVDSGGGSIGGSSATTGTDGMATAGEWKLGSAEGRNTIRATVANLTPVKFAAMALYPTATLVEGTVPATGGAVTVVSPNSPVDGLRLDVPSGAFPAATRITISVSSSLTIPHDTAVRLASPLILIESDASALSSKPLTIRVPAAIPANYFPVLGVVDAAKGFLAGVQTMDFDATGVTATLRRLDPASYEPSAAALAANRAATAAAPLKMVMYLVPMNYFTRDKNTGFAPGINDWEFGNIATTPYPFTASGAAVSERWLYSNQKIGILYEAFQRAEGVVLSNWQGIQWTTGLSKQFDAAVLPSVHAAEARQSQNKAKYDSLAAQWVVSLMYLSAGQPVLIALSSPANANDPISTLLAYGWRASERALLVADPMFPGQTSRKISFPTLGMQPYVGKGMSFTTVTSGVDNLVPSSQLSAEWPAVLNGTINRALFPTVTLASWDWLSGDTLFMVDDTTRMWNECPIIRCAGGYSSSLPVAPGSSLQTQAVYENPGSGVWPLFQAGSNYGVALDFLHLAKPSTNPYWEWEYGWIDLTAGTQGATRWNGWFEGRVLHFGFAVQPVHAAPGQSVVLDVKPLGGPSLPADAVYEWNFNDQTAKVSGRALKVVNHTYAQKGRYPLELKIYHGKSGELIARTRSSADVGIILDALSGVIDSTYRFTAHGGPVNAQTTYRWNFGDNSPPVTTTDTVAFHRYATPGTYNVTVLMLVSGTTVDNATTTARIYPGEWRLTSFTLTSSLPAKPGELAHRLVAFDSVKKYLQQVESLPSDGMLFLADNDLWVERGLYFQIAPPHSGSSLVYWGAGSQVWMVARQPSILFSSFSNTGTLWTGAMNGVGYVTLFNYGPFTGGEFLNSITATKVGNRLSGTLKFTLYDGSTTPTSRTYTFVAQLVP